METAVEKQPITTKVQVITGYKTIESKEPVYETKTVKYYSYMTRTWVEGTKDTKWSIKNDTNQTNYLGYRNYRPRYYLRWQRPRAFQPRHLL